MKNKIKVVFLPKALGRYCLLSIDGSYTSGTLLSIDLDSNSIKVKTLDSTLTVKLEA